MKKRRSSGSSENSGKLEYLRDTPDIANMASTPKEIRGEFEDLSEKVLKVVEEERETAEEEVSGVSIKRIERELKSEIVGAEQIIEEADDLRARIESLDKPGQRMLKIAETAGEVRELAAELLEIDRKEEKGLESGEIEREETARAIKNVLEDNSQLIRLLEKNVE